MDDHRAFIRAILSDPTDEVSRLVYADYLDERDDPRGQFLRLEVAEARGEPHDGDRLAELRRRLDADWLTQVERPAVEKCPLPVLKFAYRCPKRWDHLRLTEDESVRHCDTCDRPVFYCRSIEDAKDHAADGHCVAVSRHVARVPGDLDDEDLLGDLDDSLDDDGGPVYDDEDFDELD